MLRESMGGDGVQSSDVKSGAATATTSSSTNAMAYNPMHYSNSSGGSDNEPQQHFGGQLLSAATVMTGGAVSPVTCFVCYNTQVDVLLEPCGHQFHLHCIDRWLNKDKVCPICWNPIQSQRRLLVQAHYSNQQQQQQVVTPSGTQSQLPRGVYVPPPPPPSSAAASGPVATPNAAGAAPMEGASAASEPPNPAATRKGKWTTEESLYCDRLIEEFKKGNLPLAEGTTLRTFLAKLLNCDPMRISKKYTGDQCIGKVSCLGVAAAMMQMMVCSRR